MSPSLKAALEASGYIGIWETDLTTQTIELTGALPDFLGLDEKDAAAGLPMKSFLGGIHPDDQVRVAHLVQEAHRSAGRFEAEFKTLDGKGCVRRVVARGRVEIDEHGRGLRCIGVALDLTDSYFETQKSADQQMDTIDRVADALIAVRPLMDQIGSPILRKLIDAALFEVGQVLARQSDRPERRFH